MTDWEGLILQYQEELEIWEDNPDLFPGYHPEDDIIEEHYSDFILKHMKKGQYHDK